MKESLYEVIIAKFLKGDATPHEKRMLANWLKEDPAHEEFFYQQLSVRESECPQYLPEVDSKIEAYEKFLRDEVQMPVVDFNAYEMDDLIQSRKTHHRWWLAASIFLFMSVSAYFLKDPFLYTTYSADNGKIKAVTLEDGSTVTLNANSSIKIHRDFMDRKDREVWIKGEAFFEVSKKADLMKFIVHTDNFDVEVLGTKFNVNNRRGRTEVMLAEGKVKLLAKDQDPLIMKPGEQVSLSDTQHHFQKQVVEIEKHQAWRKSMLVFENTPLSEVAQVIQDHYGIKMIIRDSLLASRQFTGTLPNDDLDVILLALSTSYKIEIEHKEEYIILK